MSAGTVVIAGGILATVILLTIVGFLCLCRLQYYCCKKGESDKGEEDDPEFTAMTPSRPLALCAPPTPPTPDHLSEVSETYPPTFLTEANGPVSYSPSPPFPPPPPPALPPPPPPPPRRGQRSHGFCPSCARCTLPFYLPHHPERACNGGRRINYRTARQEDVDPPLDLTSLYHKLNEIRALTLREAASHSVSTDV